MKPFCLAISNGNAGKAQESAAKKKQKDKKSKLISQIESDSGKENVNFVVVGMFTSLHSTDFSKPAIFNELLNFYAVLGARIA